MSGDNKCPDCQVDPGEVHEVGCDVTPCKVTGDQMLACGVFSVDPHECAPCVWTGEWPGKAECREFGWYADIVGIGWTEDLNRVNRIECRWDPEAERFVRR